MRLTPLLSSAAALAILVGCSAQTETTSDTSTETTTTVPFDLASLTPPTATRIDKTIEQVGRTRVDPYNWMKDENWQDVMKDPSILREDIRDYLVEENAFTKAGLEEPLQPLVDELFEEMRGRIKEDDQSLPSVDGPFAYLTKFRTGGEYPIFARKSAAETYNEEAEVEILLDGDEMGEGKAYFAFGGLGHSPDHKLVAYAYDDQGSERYDIKFRNIETGEDLPDVVTGTAGNFVWSSNSDAVYWVERDDNGRPVAVHQYKLGSDGASTEIYREADAGFFTGVGKSQSGEYIFIGVGDQVTSEYHYFKADADTPEPKLVAAREVGVEYDIEHWGDQFVITTNADGAVDKKIVTAPVDAPGRDNWTDYIAHEAGTLILGVDVLKDHMIRTVRKEGLPSVIITDRESGDEHSIAFDEAAYSLSASTGYDYDTTQIRFNYESPSTPDQTYDYDLVTRERVLRKTREVPSGHT
ncbi:MAG: S9 family peptidase, partial [Pseudomonadota bacterium]